MERRVTKLKIIEGSAKEFEDQYEEWAKKGYELDPISISRMEYVGRIHHIGIMFLPKDIEDEMEEEEKKSHSKLKA